MEITLFRSKNVFFIAHALFSIKETSNCNDIDKNLKSFRIC